LITLSLLAVAAVAIATEVVAVAQAVYAQL
jgi:hypothetical protein